MAGHSHFKNIKRTKDLEARKKATSFLKVGKLISLLVREGGSDIESNPALKSAVEKARKMNVPKENIEKAIRRGSGQDKGDFLESFVLEAYGPGKEALIIEGITDNKNRSFAEIKQIVQQNGGKIINPGGIKWMFDNQEESGKLKWFPKYEIEVPEDVEAACEKMIEFLNENDSVQNVFTNIKKK